MSTAEEIVKAVGGPDNISNLTHCATRLRFELVDGSKADADKVDAIDGVMGAVPQGANHFQVIIGGAVQTVFNEINALPEMSNRKQPTDEEVKAAARAGGVRGKAAWVDSFFEFLSDSFRPVLGALLGASLFITFMSLMTTMKVIGNWADDEQAKLLSPSWQFVNLLWKSVLYFLPLMVAYNASKKVGADPWVGFAIMGVLMLPGFLALKPIPKGEEYAVVDIFGLPMTIFNYGSQVFPPLLIAALLGPLYKLLKKVIPSNIQLIFVPFFAMLIMMPLAAYLIGPAGVYMGSWLAHSLESINRLSPLILSLFIPLIYPFMVPLGLHWPINAIMLVNIRTLGYDYIEGPMGAWNFACYGATAGVFFLAWRDREKQMRQTATGALVAGLVGGISEPSLYGIHLRFKRIYPLMLGGCVLGGRLLRASRGGSGRDLDRGRGPEHFAVVGDRDGPDHLVVQVQGELSVLGGGDQAQQVDDVAPVELGGLGGQHPGQVRVPHDRDAALGGDHLAGHRQLGVAAGRRRHVDDDRSGAHGLDRGAVQEHRRAAPRDARRGDDDVGLGGLLGVERVGRTRLIGAHLLGVAVGGHLLGAGQRYELRPHGTNLVGGLGTHVGAAHLRAQGVGGPDR